MKLKYFPAKSPISPLLLRFLVTRSDRQGFTLLELLTAMVIGSIIVSTLLYGVVNILQTDQRDASRSDTQRDMQMAMDYIARDVREATYVYGITQDTITSAGGATSLGPKESCLYDYGEASSLERGKSGKCTGLLNYLPNVLKTGSNRPVLAFWKAEPLPSTIQTSCRGQAGNVGKITGETGFSSNLNSTPCVAQRMYTLVVYSLDIEPASIWRGKARIKRYQLPHFTEEAAIGPNAITKGWVSPIAKDKRPRTWPVGNGTKPGGEPEPNGDLQFGIKPTTGDNQVLTDFVDNDVRKVGLYRPGYCPNGFDAPNGFTALGPNPEFNPAFYVCVRSGGLTVAAGATAGATLATEAAETAGQGVNPEVHIVLKGNAAGRGGIPILTGEVPFQMETRVLSRGAFGKLSNNN